MCVRRKSRAFDTGAWRAAPDISLRAPSCSKNPRQTNSFPATRSAALKRWPPHCKPDPPPTSFFKLSYPKPGILLVTIDRAEQRNSLPSEAHWEGHNIFSWFDEEPTLLVAIVTGAGEKAFCAGQDLVNKPARAANPRLAPRLRQRRGKKPVLAAVNGFALGGGFEICLNCDMIVASPKAQFGLPEVAVGLYAAAGGLPRLVRIVGLPLASEFAMTGRKLSAKEALDLGLINRISQSAGTVVEETIALAQEITKNSPDGVIVTRQGIREAWGNASVEDATSRTRDEYMSKLAAGENFKIGVGAFAAKKQPKWVPPKL
ncbi:hypothetical protein N7470_005831 [Penicillium chermesinum]|nr:hypothetical protein N7470_005831 [Penicillium chermesinum]